MKQNFEQPQYLTFHLAGEEYAVGILRVREIIEYGTVTKVPTMPEFVRGVINLRGSVVPVVDISVKLGLAPSTISKWSCIVIVEVRLDDEDTIVGVLVDAMGQVIQLAPHDLEKPPVFGTRVRGDCLQGMGKVGNKFIIILDIDKVLSEAETFAAPLAIHGPDVAGFAGPDEVPAQ